MRKILAVAIVALAAAGPASAKEIVGVQLCGASGCESVQGNSVSAILHEGPGGPLADNGAAVAPAKPGDWYRGYALIGDRGKVHARIPFYYVPGNRTIVAPGMGAQTTTWMNTTAAWRHVLGGLAQRVTPYGPPTVTRASLNGDAAADPESYLSLFTIGTKATTYPKESTSIQIVLESKPRSPWTDGNGLVLYPKSHLLVRDGQFVSIRERVADRAAAHAGLAGDARSFPWLPVAVAALLAAVAAAAALLARRAPWRRPEAGTA